MYKLIAVLIVIVAISAFSSIVALIIEDERIKRLILREIRRTQDKNEVSKFYDTYRTEDEEESQTTIL